MTNTKIRHFILISRLLQLRHDAYSYENILFFVLVAWLWYTRLATMYISTYLICRKKLEIQIGHTHIYDSVIRKDNSIPTQNKRTTRSFHSPDCVQVYNSATEHIFFVVDV